MSVPLSICLRERDLGCSLFSAVMCGLGEKEKSQQKVEEFSRMEERRRHSKQGKHLVLQTWNSERKIV